MPYQTLALITRGGPDPTSALRRIRACGQLRADASLADDALARPDLHVAVSTAPTDQAPRTFSMPVDSGHRGRHATLGVEADHDELPELIVNRLSISAPADRGRNRFDLSGGP